MTQSIPPIDKVAWILLRDGKLLSTRNHGRELFYFPGGKREAGEQDLDTLVREIKEELTVDIRRETARLYGVFEAQADAQNTPRLVTMACYFASYDGMLKPSNEIAEMAWFTYADRHRVSLVDTLVFDQLRADNLLGNVT